MSDSTAMTVEFLRARLLSERSVSRTAKQRADQLAKRVVELEEQLRIVTNQRRKAEKAAVEVLSILEAQGLGEVDDSSTDQEDVPGEQKGCEDTVKEDDSSTTSRMDRSEVDDALSESERVVAPKDGRSLSWKGNNNNQDSYGKKRIYHNRQRQRRSFLCTIDSSPRHPLGKSCRKNKRKEMGFLVQNGKDNSKLHDTQEKMPPTHREDAVEKGFDDCPENSNEASANDNDTIDDLIKCSVDDRNTNPTQNGFSKEEEMEEALEKQAQLILLYQAEENSQREWEEKFNENKCTTVLTSLPNPTRIQKREVVVSLARPARERGSTAESFPPAEIHGRASTSPIRDSPPFLALKGSFSTPRIAVHLSQTPPPHCL